MERVTAEQRQTEEQNSLNEEQAFLSAYNKRSALQTNLEDFQAAQDELQRVQQIRRGDFRNVQGLIDQAQSQGLVSESATFREVVTAEDAGPEEQQYLEARNGVTAAVENVRVKKEALKNLGVDAEGLSDEELRQAVHDAQEESNKAIQEFLRKHPESELPEANEEREKRVAALEKQIEQIQRNIESHTQWGRENVALNINGWHDNLDGFLEQEERSLTFPRAERDRNKEMLAQLPLYRSMFKGGGVMGDPEVVKTYQPAVDANNAVRELEGELRVIQNKPTSKFFGYTESKKNEEVAAKKAELEAKRKEAEGRDEAYRQAAQRYSNRLNEFNRAFFSGEVKIGENGYQETQSGIEKAIKDAEDRLRNAITSVDNAKYYVANRKTLLEELESASTELAAMNGVKKEG